MNKNTASATNNDSGNTELLQKLKSQAFDASDEKLAIALGRPVEEITAWLGGAEIDEDAQEKIHGLATVRLSD
ncbi:MAG: hypothetical protein M3033_00515 [Acidobacteriota bacterium]|nr:hypothetical protein [Acidobacteriota bacterium]